MNIVAVRLANPRTLAGLGKPTVELQSHHAPMPSPKHQREAGRGRRSGMAGPTKKRRMLRRTVIRQDSGTTIGRAHTRAASPSPRRHRSVHARTHSHAARPLAGRASSALLDRCLRRASWGRGCESMAGRTRASGSVPDFDFHVRRASIQSIPFAGRGRTNDTGPQRSSLAR